MAIYTIWKVVLKTDLVQDIEVPEGAEMLTAREQHNQICVWLKCDPSRPKSKRRIAVIETWQAAPEGARYIGTGFLEDGRSFHVFDFIAD